MSDFFVGEIQLFGFDFAPKGWALCNGQLLSIPQNTALFALLGTTYGGNGRQLSRCRICGRLPMGQGNGPGLTPRMLGETFGEETIRSSSAKIRCTPILFKRSPIRR